MRNPQPVHDVVQEALFEDELIVVCRPGHPLLEQGLVILDTPGLNAIGAEPELTLSLLPNAHAVLFILAADTGVTQSDLSVWREYVNAGQRRDGRLVVLNKIDSLWVTRLAFDGRRWHAEAINHIP